MDAFLAAYFDGIVGYQRFRLFLIELQQQSAEAGGPSVEESDGKAFIVGEGDPNLQTAKVLLSTTQADLKQRNEPDGANSVFLARMLIVAVYQLWEDHYRDQIADERGVERNQVTSDLFGDLRHYRRSIIHNRGLAVDEVRRNHVLRWFPPGAEVSPTRVQMRSLIGLLRAEVERFKSIPPAV